jgi:hypothetical protein
VGSIYLPNPTFFSDVDQRTASRQLNAGESEVLDLTTLEV